MKKAVMALLLGLAVFAWTGCSNPSLNTYVNHIQRQLPYDLGDGQELTDCRINGDYVDMTMEMDESEFSLDNDDVRFVVGLMSGVLEEELLNDKDIRDLLEQCQAEGKGFRLFMKGKTSGYSIPVIDLSAEELQDAEF